MTTESGLNGRCPPPTGSRVIVTTSRRTAHFTSRAAAFHAATGSVADASVAAGEVRVAAFSSRSALVDPLDHPLPGGCVLGAGHVPVGEHRHEVRQPVLRPLPFGSQRVTSTPVRRCSEPVREPVGIAQPCGHEQLDRLVDRFDRAGHVSRATGGAPVHLCPIWLPPRRHPHRLPARTDGDPGQQPFTAVAVVGARGLLVQRLADRLDVADGDGLTVRVSMAGQSAGSATPRRDARERRRSASGRARSGH